MKSSPLLRAALVILIIAILVPGSAAQNTWGKADPAQFSVRVCPIDTSTSAMVLLDSCAVSYVWDNYQLYVEYRYYKRIQILRKEGFGYATMEMAYSVFGNFSSLDGLEAQTLNLNDAGKVQVSKIKPKAIFDEKLSEGFYIKKFAFPEIREGSIIEYHYTSRNTALGNLNDWYFQGQLPVMRSAMILSIPDFYKFKMLLESEKPVSVNETTKVNDWMGSLSFEDIVHHYAMDSIPAFKAEPFITTPNDFVSKLVFIISEARIPGRSIKYYAANWEEVARDLMKSPAFGGLLNENGPYLSTARQLAGNITDTLEKIKVIYDYIRNRMKWNKAYSHLSYVNLNKCFSDSAGNSCAINLMLISMLREVGIKACPVLISTRNHGLIEKVYPMEKQFNHVIAMALADTGWILLDPINKLRPWSLLGENDLNKWGLKVTETKTDSFHVYNADWVTIQPRQRTMIGLNSVFKVDSAGNLTGHARLSASDYLALTYRNEAKDKTDKEKLMALVKPGDEVDLNNITVDNLDSIAERLKINFDIIKKDSTGGNGEDVIYINPFPVKYYADNPFKLNERTYPVNFNYPFERSITTSITIPENFKVSELPKSVNYTLPDGSAVFSLLAAQTEYNIQVKSTLKINLAEYSPVVYADLKALYAKMIDAYNSTIVMEKSK